MREKGLPSVNLLKTCLVILTFFHIVSAQTAKETVDKCVALLTSRSYVAFFAIKIGAEAAP